MATEVAQSTAPPANAEEDGWALPGGETQRPYLRFIGPPPLRFQDILPPSDVAARPPPGGPPKSGGKTAADIVRMPVLEVPVAAQPVLPVAAAKPDGTEKTKPAAKPDALPPGPAPLVPDDGAPKARPEDFLPFFQFPGAKTPSLGAGAPAAPSVPGIQPPSSATYQQQ
jgi:hypothetical protein